MLLARSDSQQALSDLLPCADTAMEINAIAVLGKSTRGRAQLMQKGGEFGRLSMRSDLAPDEAAAPPVPEEAPAAKEAPAPSRWSRCVLHQVIRPSDKCRVWGRS